MSDFSHNDIGISVLSDKNYKKLFGYEPFEIFDPSFIPSKKLTKFQNLPDKNLPNIPALPYISGNQDIEDYFTQVAQNHFDYYDLDAKIESLLSITRREIKKLTKLIPKLIESGKSDIWTKIDVDGNISFSEEFEPPSSVFDTETFVKGSECNSPIVAQAIGRDLEEIPSLYMWLHPNFDNEEIDYEPMKVSIGQNKLLVGHNFAFDRQKILEFFTLERSTNICICTMAMMQLVGGVDAKQRWALNIDPRKQHFAAKIQSVGCRLGLVPTYEFMLGKSLPDDAKDLRKIFVKAKVFQEFRDSRVDILTYSMFDVIYNLELFQAAYDVFSEKANHKAILAGQTIVLDAIVPHIDWWDEWVETCDTEYAKIEKEVFDLIFPYAEKIHKDWLNTEEISSVLEYLNWDVVRPFRHRKDKPLPEGWPVKAKWFDNLEKKGVKLKGNDLGILLQCEYFYEGKWRTVLFDKNKKYHVLKNGKLIRLPNRKNPGQNFGNILGSDALYLATKEEPALRSTLLTDEEFLHLLKLVDKTSTYVGFKNRVISQNKLNGLVAAEVHPSGTISGRTKSSLYNTLPAHWDEPKIMSEIKMASQCPDGYVFVGGDADQQEASIACAMADSHYGLSGASDFAKAILAGTKAEGTDYHSLTAKNITGKENITGDERFAAKGPNFGLIYGAGVGTTAKTISLGFDYEMGLSVQKARKAVKGFKGEKSRGYFELQGGFVNLPADPFLGGIASDVFNKMTDMIVSRPPQGLFFGNQWPKALWPEICGTSSSPPQLNYCIQASCSTYGFLSAWVISIMDEIRRNDLKARFSISIHDEVWFLCPEEEAEELAYWIIICYARTWALLHNNLNIVDLPAIRAFPSSICIDPILRKSPDASTLTPTFPQYPSGREVTIYDFVKKCHNLKQ